MKKLFLIVLFLSSLCFGQVRTYKDFNFYADSVSAAFKVDRGYSLAGLFIPEARVDTLKFKVSDNGTDFYYLTVVADSLYTIAIDSTEDRALSFVDTPLEAWQWIEIIIDVAHADTFAIGAILRGK